ncbi:TrmH family RNA methyltransferase [Mangrovibacterium marinum]|uniref:TrmH family RNA methyltransferase n=1 Tax=Mangrovibacterium marinum TaxID=1639118 RepID=A0A2T5C144_9BACT|nr:TrmH family RNA methyltransferase [Mangrovibacterium marinum]PTN08334.1 TrmH family RNA methyltransferase [Mangrovibacterium marinum]
METNSVAFFNAETAPSLPVKPIVAAWKVKNPQNVGSLMRLVDNLGGEKLILLDDEIPKREASIRKTAGLSFKNVSLYYQSSADFFDQIPDGYAVCAIETAEGASNLFTTKLPDKIVFLLGSETHGLNDQLLERCSHAIYIPMTGKCKSMNISHALAVCLFEWQRQQLFSAE